MADKQNTIYEKWKEGEITILPPKKKTLAQKSLKANRNQKTNKNLQNIKRKTNN